MIITPEQLKTLELAHDAVREAHDRSVDLYGYTNVTREYQPALDNLTAAIEALKEGK